MGFTNSVGVVLSVLAIPFVLSVFLFVYPKVAVRVVGRIQYRFVIQVREGQETLPADIAWMAKVQWRQTPAEHIAMLRTMMAEPEKVPIAILVARIAALVIGLFSSVLIMKVLF